jgi:hypothetical protein
VVAKQRLLRHLRSKRETKLTSMQTAELERVRNNQRRSRAKRKAYVAELQEKIRRYESSESGRDTGRTVQDLIKENDALRRLLLSVGLGNDFLEAYINASGRAVEVLKSAGQSNNQITLDNKNCCKTDGSPSSVREQVIIISFDL